MTIKAIAIIIPITHQKSKLTNQDGKLFANTVCGITKLKIIQRPIIITIKPQNNGA